MTVMEIGSSVQKCGIVITHQAPSMGRSIKGGALGLGGKGKAGGRGGCADGVSSSRRRLSIQFKCILLVHAPSCSVKQGHNFFSPGGLKSRCTVSPPPLSTGSTPKVNSFTLFFSLLIFTTIAATTAVPGKQ